MKSLLEGVRFYRTHVLPKLAPLFESVAKAQSPHTLLFACCDSRVIPSLILSADPGDVFVVRSIGNLLPPASGEGISTGDVSEAAAIEYAVDLLKVERLVICGHSNCGAMNALYTGVQNLTAMPHLQSWMKFAVPAWEKQSALRFPETLPAVDRLSQANVLTQLGHAMSYPAVARAVQEGRLGLHGVWFEVQTGEIRFFDRKRKEFVLIEETTERRLEIKST